MSKLTYLAKRLESGRISRREFMGRAVAAGISLSAASMLAAETVQAAEPKQGGTLRLGLADFATTDSLDPSLLDTRMQQHLTWQLRNNLVEIGPGGTLIPELAESWDGSDDAVQWRFTLRKGVEFHNGKSLAPEDVIYSMNLHTKEDSKSSAKPFVAQISNMQKTAPGEVTFTLKSGNQDFPAILGLYNLCIVPDGTVDFSDGIGTGGYMLERFEPGVNSRVKRNPNYWKAGRAHFDAVEMIAIKDTTARTNALISGQIDAFNFVELKTVHLLERARGVRVLQTQGKAHYAFASRTDTAPFSNNDVRLALKYAIDREDVLQRILKGYGSLGNDQPISSSYRFYNEGLEQRSYDPDKARFHAKKGGIDGATISLHVAETPFAGATDMALLYSEHMKKAGLDLKVVREPDDGFWSNVWAQKPFFATRWSGRITEDAMFSTAYSVAALETGWNETYFNNARLNTLLDAARVESDAAKRREMYGEAQSLIRDEGGIVVPVFADWVDAASEKLGMGPLSSEFDLDGCRCGERWWFV